MYKMTNGLVDLKPTECTPRTNDRLFSGQPNNLLLPQSTTDALVHSFLPSAIRLWNRIPHEASFAGTLTAFKSAVDGWVRSAREPG